MGSSPNKHEYIIKLCAAAMFTALICVATMVIQIPVPLGGFVNFGDSFIIICSWVLGPVYGFAAGGIGSALADIFSGYAVYAPCTFAVKGLIGVTSALVAHAVISRKESLRTVAHLTAAAAAELVMAAGYYLYDALFMGLGFEAAVATLLPNMMQAVAGIVFSFVIAEVIRRTKIMNSIGNYAM